MSAPRKPPAERPTGSGIAARVVPAMGATAWLTALTSAAMAFLAVFALALALASARLAERWSAALAQTATVRVSAPAEQMDAQLRIVRDVLRTTPGITDVRLLDMDAQAALLEPWFGPDLPLDVLHLPRLFEITDTGADMQGLRLRLSAEAPGAVLDDHTRWRRPLVDAAARLRLLGGLSIALIGGAMAAMIALAASASLAANAQVVTVLRLVGASDRFIARAFVRRLTLRALGGAGIGTLAGMGAVAALPPADPAGGLLTGLGFAGAGWLYPLIVPPVAGLVAWTASRITAFRVLRKVT